MLSDKKLIVIDAAEALFYRHGFRRITMNDIADKAEMSRPALYNLFTNKEDIFDSVLKKRGKLALVDISEQVKTANNLRDKLILASDYWCVTPYRLIQENPECKDLVECSHNFCKNSTMSIKTEFENLLCQLLNNDFPDNTNQNAMMVRLLVSSFMGFKANAKDTNDLRLLIKNQIALVLTTLQLK